MSVPPKLVRRAKLSTNKTPPLSACVFTYTLSWNGPPCSTDASAANVLVHTPLTCALVTRPCSAYSRPAAHATHSLSVLSAPETIVTSVGLAKCGSKYTTVSAGAVSLANRFMLADTDNAPLEHVDDHRVTNSLLFAFACQK